MIVVKVTRSDDKTGKEILSIDFKWWALFIIGAIPTILALIVGLATFWFINKPNNDAILDQYIETREIQLLNMVLRDTSPENRLNSVKMLVNAGLLKDSKKSLLNLEKSQIPNWEGLDTLILMVHKPEIIEIKLPEVIENPTGK